MEHQESCWYKAHDENPEFNIFVPIMWDKSVVPGFKINRKGDIQGFKGYIRSTPLQNGYPQIKLCNKVSPRLVHQFMADTFFQEEVIENGVVDHINSNRRLNHVRNLRPTTQRMNNVYANGINIVVKHKETEVTTHYDTIDDCTDVFAEMYPTIKSELLHADKVVDKDLHIFYRDPKRNRSYNKFYLD